MSDFSDKGKVVAPPAICNDITKLAPKFRADVEAAISECQAKGFDAIVYETIRSQELQAEYYALGRTVVPPYQPVTNAADADYSWHFYGLAVDVISKRDRWSVGESWSNGVAAIFKAHGCDWGGDWVNMKDLPHFQFAGLKPSPSELSRQLYADGGAQAVWEAVGAI